MFLLLLPFSGFAGDSCTLNFSDGSQQKVSIACSLKKSGVAYAGVQNLYGEGETDFSSEEFSSRDGMVTIFQKPNEDENWHSFIDTSKKMPLLTSLASIDNDTDIKNKIDGAVEFCIDCTDDNPMISVFSCKDGYKFDEELDGAVFNTPAYIGCFRGKSGTGNNPSSWINVETQEYEDVWDILDCIKCVDQYGYYEGYWAGDRGSFDFTNLKVRDWCHFDHVTKADCVSESPVGVYEKIRGKYIKTKWFYIEPLLVPEPQDGKIYRLVATECEDGYNVVEGRCKKAGTHTENNNKSSFDFTALDSMLDEYFNDSSKWKDDEGGFNTARLASDSIAGVILGTTGGIVTSKIIKKNQIKSGFESLKCTIGGQDVANFGDEFKVGVK